jgi:hypothetical protein
MPVARCEIVGAARRLPGSRLLNDKTERLHYRLSADFEGRLSEVKTGLPLWSKVFRRVDLASESPLSVPLGLE